MFDLIKKSVLAGIGAIVVTEEKLQEAVDDFVQKGKLTQQEGQSLVTELQKVIRENKEKLSDTIDERVTCLMKELPVLTKDDLAEFQRSVKHDIQALEQRIQQLEKQNA